MKEKEGLGDSLRKGEITMATEQQRQDAMYEIVAAVYMAIKESGSMGIPSGHLYAALMGKLSLDSYQAIIGILVETGKISNNHHLLVAV